MVVVHAAGSSAAVSLIATAKPWTYWLAPIITLGAVLAILAIVVGYIVKVFGAKYPRQ